MDLIYHPGASADLDDAVTYYESQRAGLGRAFREEVQRVFSVENPKPDGEAWRTVGVFRC